MAVSVYRADPVTWLDIFAAVSPVLSALLSALIAIGGVLATLWFTNRWQQQRLDHERAVRLRDERIEAYRKMLTATTKAHKDREAVAELSAAYVEISLLASTDEIDRTAAEVEARYFATQEASEKLRKDPETPASEYAQALNRARAARDEFLKLAREELGIKGRTAGFHDLEGDDPGEELSEAEEPAERRPWWRRVFGS